ncbi:MAG TPA: bifunctional nicotinamide-nucleotide adenylyltransferase/Nudix hydroxylase [Luteimonas sp.]|nr:bifunctional nicotinamide-nucleotide adenylyltransferase/Nudix hydroxylase [Luteimonas sp.]
MRLDTLVLVGQFAPFHNGHLALLHRALDRADRVIVLMGSAGRARNSRHPWTAPEREQMLRAAVSAESGRIQVKPLRDHLYNENAWITAVQAAVREALGADASSSRRVGLVGGPEHTGVDYLRAFPQWPREEVAPLPCLRAEDLRANFLDGSDEGMATVRAHVPPGVADFLMTFREESPAYPALVEERRFIERYRQGWEAAPYPPTFVTVDGVVVHSGHVLLVQRGAQPGKGQWALPGGFVRGDERLLDAVLRELREETRLKLPAPVLRGSLRARETFDHPERSLRGRTITHAFHFDFPSGELPPVKGGDDAAKARWFPLSELRSMESQMYEDHFHIIEHFIGTL